jgi:methionyl-tRNA formyltransferase
VRVVFMGTPEFAVPSLRALVAAYEVACVYTRPDSISGRGTTARPSAVKAAALELGLEVRSPRTLRDDEALRALVALHADLLVVAAYGLILPSEALDAAALGAVNIHASLLPRWRGAAPIQRAILAGDDRTGVSIMRMEQGLDTGPYCLRLDIPIGEASAVELTDRLATLGAKALLKALPSIVDGSAAWVVQDESQATYAEKISKDDVAVGPHLTRSECLRRVRASSSAAPSRVLLGGRGATIMSALDDQTAIASGSVACSKTSLLLGVADGAIQVTDIKPDGKGVMQACAWARGVRELDGATWAGAR